MLRQLNNIRENIGSLVDKKDRENYKGFNEGLAINIRNQIAKVNVFGLRLRKWICW